MKLKDSSFIPKPSLSFDFEFDINDDSQLLFVFGNIKIDATATRRSLKYIHIPQYILILSQ